MSGCRIAFMGSPEIAKYYLKILIENNFNICAVYSQPARPKGRGMKIQLCPVQVFGEKNNLKVFNPKSLNNKKEIERFKALRIDLTIVMGYGNLLPIGFIENCKYGCINIHLSLLPRWRGASPIEHALIAGDQDTGVTIFKLTSKMDEGPIIASKSCRIERSMNKDELETELNNIGTDLMIKTIPNYIQGNLRLYDQDSNLSTYAPKISTAQRQINFKNNAIEVQYFVRAYSTQPGAWFMFNDEMIKILKCSINEKKGTSAHVLSKDFLIGCADKSIKPLILQREGKKAMQVEDFLRGFNFSIGDKILYHA